MAGSDGRSPSSSSPLAAIGINLYIWLNVKKGRFSAQKGKARSHTRLILLVSLVFVMWSPARRAFRRRIPLFPPPSGRSSRKAIKQSASASSAKGNTTFAEAEEGSRDFSAMAAGWTYATTIKDAAAEEFWAVLEKTELTPHINAFTLTGSGTKFGCCTGWTGQIPMHRCCTSVLLRTDRFGSSGSLSCRSLCPLAGCS